MSWTRPAKIVAACGVGLAAVVALSWWVGWLGPEEGFDWDLASVFGTALGTTLLALATGALALLTYREVSATQELAALTRKDQQIRERPLVLATSTDWWPHHLGGAESRLMIELSNVGLGPAVGIEVTANYHGPGDQPTIIQGIWTAIQPGATAPCPLVVIFHEAPDPSVRADHFTPAGTYLDRSRGNEERIIAKADLRRSGHR
jgi:hypothetical protein